MKKILVVLIILAMAALALTACGDSNNDTGSNNNADTGAITSIGQLSDATLGVQLGTTGHILAQEEFPDAELDAYIQFTDAVMALLAGSIDAVIVDNLTGVRFVAANEGNLKLLDDELSAESYGIAFQLGSEYTAMFDDAIDQLRANGTFQAIYDYWILELEGAARYVTPEGTEHPNGTLRMATNPGFPPFELMEGTQIVGFDPCLAQAIGDILGYEIEIVDMNFDAIILAVQSGQVDFGMAGMTITEERRESVDFSQGYFSSGQRALVRAS